MISTRDNELGARREQGQEALLSLSQLALDGMEQGVCVYDADNRIVLVNRRYIELFDMSPDIVRLGTCYRDVLAHSMARGNIPADELDALYASRIALIAAGEPFQTRQTLASGLVITLDLKPLPGGGWMTICDDVSRLARLETELKLQTERSQHALAHMSHGLIMYDAEGRFVVCNERFLQLYDLDPNVLKPGIAHEPVIDHWLSRGNRAEISGDAFRNARTNDVRTRSPKTILVTCYDGRKVQAVSRFMPDGGWVTVHEDVTERLQHEETLKQQNLMLDAALENMAHGLAFYDSDMRLRICNSTYQEIYRLSPEESKPGTHLSELIERSMANGAFSSQYSPQQILEAARARIANRDSSPMRRSMTNNTVISVRYCALPDGGFVATYEDITERERAVEELSEQYRRFDAALNNMSQGLCMLDANLHVIVCNRRYIEMYGLSFEIVKPGVSMREIMEHSCDLGIHPNTTAAKLYADYVERLREGEHTLHRHLSDGRIIKLNHKRMEHGGWVVTYEDVTERHKAQARVAHMAQHDSLTDLPNRTLFREKMSEGLNQVAIAGGAMAVLCFDLDNFKTVNDRLGHAAGDRLLRWVAARLRENVGEHDTVARLGGDEFAVLQRGPQPQSAEKLARRLVEIIGHPPPLESQSIHVGVSVGIAIAPDHGLDADELMKCADLALYQAKAKGRGAYQLFEPAMEEAARSRHALEHDLRGALESNQFHLVFQPQVRLDTTELTGFEALLRWKHPSRGFVSPAEFIPIAEENGLIVPIGEWVLRRACATAASWPGVTVAVNLSPVQFRSRGLVAMVTSALAEAGLPPQRLELEVTETALLDDSEATIGILHQLRALGVRVSLDDFGVGYSSLSYLRKFPFDRIKIDRSFVGTLGESPESVAIVRTIASLGSVLGVETTAEGVETVEQLDFVRECGCTAVQGYYFGKPCPAAEVGRTIETLNAVRRVA
ncbi:PAS-domain containing protein [Bradyrhizobium sp. GCM10027634]|uniref:PAS-domain containing protein n=1 Tax=unclassified Bradyrhizobium TaxID=2631580 RepID=UPI00188CAD94|nr:MULTISPECIES: PAS-domain containing protein [unclassified Bradyrhizobium]MDN5003025.1 PAS-domain containing protein [Bradyrhizobium sp. WYCCWR 12677]QOZ48366.1 bifunctional diguanylate cyclase/phosphodiesterase [Bradyrhizobium sp. CCBAU 53340]